MAVRLRIGEHRRHLDRVRFLRPTLKQRIIASDRLPQVFMLAIALFFPIWIATTLELNFATFLNPWNCLLFVVIVVLSFVAGLFGSLLIAWLFLGPALLAQTKLNGGPFAVGDKVQIINGEHRGRVTTVYSKWQHDTNRVELGADAKENFLDIYADHQLLRADGKSESQDNI